MVLIKRPARLYLRSVGHGSFGGIQCPSCLPEEWLLELADTSKAQLPQYQGHNAPKNISQAGLPGTLPFS